MFFDFGRTITDNPSPPSIIIDLNINLHLRLKMFLWTAPPYFVETENPIHGSASNTHLRDKSPLYRDIGVSIICEKRGEEREKFNYAERDDRPFLRRLESIARPALVPIRFKKPCLFLRFLLVYFIVIFILVLLYLITAK